MSEQSVKFLSPKTDDLQERCISFSRNENGFITIETKPSKTILNGTKWVILSDEEMQKLIAFYNDRT